VKQLGINEIRIDGGTQPRVHLNEGAVSEYAEALTDGDKLPAVTVFFDGSEYWLADGFHRYFAHKTIGALKIDADVRSGSRRDAVLHSVGANASHGLRRTNEDKRRAVETLLADEEWSKWSDREIARQCGVSHPFVADIRSNLVAGAAPETRTVERNGKVYEQRVSKIGKGMPKSDVSAPQADPAPASVSVADAEPTVPICAEDADDFGPSDEELAFHEEKERADQAAYDALVEAAMSDDRLGAALHTVAEQAEEIARLKAELRMVKESRDSYMSGKNEAIRMVKSLQRKLEKFEKAAA